MKKLNQLSKKINTVLQIFLSSIKTKVAIKFPKKPFPAENRPGTERVNETVWVTEVNQTK